MITCSHDHSGMKDGRANYYSMHKAYQHDLGIDGKHFTAYNMSSGLFGGVRGREMFVVQSMDGKLMILEQSAHAFSRQLSDCLIPGPIIYVPKTDAFVTVNFATTAECYRYQVLASSQSSDAGEGKSGGEAKSGSGGRNSNGLTAVRSAMVEWSLKLGEPCRQVLEGNFSNSTSGEGRSAGHQSELLLVCDKTLFLVRGETGAVLQQKRLERSDASCVCAYPVAGSGSGSLNFILAGMDCTLQVYSGFNLVWAAKAPTVPVQMAVASFGGQHGLIVTVDDRGSLCASYLGTKPPVNAVTTHVRDINYDQVDEEHRALLQVIRESQSDAKIEPTEKLVIRSQLGKTLDSEPHSAAMGDTFLPPSSMLVPAHSSAGGGGGLDRDGQFVKVCVRLYLTHVGAQPATNVSLVVSCPSFVHAVPNNVILQRVAGGSKAEPTMVKVYMYALRASLPTGLDATVTATYTSSNGEPRVVSHTVALPLYLACRPAAPSKSALCKVILDTEGHAAVPLTDLFADLLYAAQDSGVDVNEVLGSAATRAMGFQLFPPSVTNLSAARINSSSGSGASLSPVVSIMVSKNSGRYLLQADSFPALQLIASELERRLNAKLAPVGGDANSNSNSSLLSAVSVARCADPIPTDDYFLAVGAHFATRQRLNELSSALNDCAHQYRLVEKRLLVRFKDKNPTPLGGLDLLLRETYDRIIKIGA